GRRLITECAADYCSWRGDDTGIIEPCRPWLSWVGFSCLWGVNAFRTECHGRLLTQTRRELPDHTRSDISRDMAQAKIALSPCEMAFSAAGKAVRSGRLAGAHAVDERPIPFRPVARRSTDPPRGSPLP